MSRGASPWPIFIMYNVQGLLNDFWCCSRFKTKLCLQVSLKRQKCFECLRVDLAQRQVCPVHALSGVRLTGRYNPEIPFI